MAGAVPHRRSTSSSPSPEVVVASLAFLFSANYGPTSHRLDLLASPPSRAHLLRDEEPMELGLSFVGVGATC